MGCLLACLALPAAAAECTDLPPSQVSVRRLDSLHHLDHQYSYRELRQVRPANMHVARPDEELLGLTVGEAVARISARSDIVTIGTRRECISHQLQVEFGYQPVTVHIAREFEPGSCAETAIREHELRHVEAFEQHARAIEGEIKAALEQRFADAPARPGNRGDGLRRLQQELQKHWLPYLRRNLDKVNALHRIIDSREEYLRIAMSCGGAIQRALGAPR